MPNVFLEEDNNPVGSSSNKFIFQVIFIICKHIYIKVYIYLMYLLLMYLIPLHLCFKILGILTGQIQDTCQVQLTWHMEVWCQARHFLTSNQPHMGSDLHWCNRRGTFTGFGCCAA